MFAENNNRLDKLESKMDILEQTLNEIKTAIRERKESEVSSERNPSIEEREAGLSEVEIAKIRSVMKQFDFQKVHDIMKSLGWRWAFSENGTPSVEELKTEAHRLLVKACAEETNIATGGFRAVYEKESGWEDDDSPYVGLEFIVEECEGFENDEDDDWKE